MHKQESMKYTQHYSRLDGEISNASKYIYEMMKQHLSDTNISFSFRSFQKSEIDPDQFIILCM